MTVQYLSVNGSHASKELFTSQLIDSPPPVISFDVETISIKERMPIGFGISTTPNDAWYFTTYPEYDPEIELVLPLLRNPAIKKAAHNAMFDLRCMPLIAEGLDYTNIADTNVMARILGRINTRLFMLHADHLRQVNPASEMLKGGKTMLDLRPIDVAVHCMEDCMATMALYEKYSEEIRLLGLDDYFDIEMQAMPILVDMSLRGIHINQHERQEFEDALTKEVEFYRDYCEHQMPSHLRFNPASNQQVAFVLSSRGSFLPFTKGSRRPGAKKNLCTDEPTLEGLADPLASMIINFRKSNKLLSTYIQPLRDQDRAYTEYNFDAVVGRISSSNFNMQNIPGPDSVKKSGSLNMRNMYMPDNGVFTTGDFCLAPETLVLTDKLEYIRIDSIKPGDTLIGIDEHPADGKGSRRKLRPSIVYAVGRPTRPSYRITMKDGRTIVASAEHPWLIMDSIWHNSVAQHPTWVETQHITKGTLIRQLGPTWKEDNSYLSGYISGFLDGEGWIDASYHMVGFGQNDNIALDFMMFAVDQLGFNPTRAKGSNSTTIQYKFTDIYSMMKVIGVTRPKRLLEKSYLLWEGYEPPKLNAWAEVASIEYIGEVPLVSISTSTNTFIANGLFTHNSQEHLRILCYLSGDVEMGRVYIHGEFDGDIHQKTANEVRINRQMAKTLNYAIPYGATAETINQQGKFRDQRKAKRLLDGWFRAYPQAYEWLMEAQRYGMKHSWSLPTIFGRSIFLPDEGMGKQMVEAKARKAVNYPILGTDGEVMKRAIIICKKHNLPMAVTVHDSITLDGNAEFPIEELENITPFRLPFEVKRTLRWE